MKLRNPLIIVIALLLLFIGGYGMSLYSTINKQQQETYRFKVNDPVWIIEGNRPGVIYRVNPSAPLEDFRYAVSYFSHDERVVHWMNEGSLDPLTNQVPRASHEQ